MSNKNIIYNKSVLLLYSNDSHRGPGKVVQNLKIGLRKLGVVTHTHVDNNKSCEFTGYLQVCHPEILTHYAKTKKPVLMGPNLFVLPTDNPSLCTYFNHFVVPSEWVKNMYEKFDLMNGKHIHVWPVGIDTDKWKPFEKPKTDEIDCIVYFKNRAEQDLAIVEAICRKFGLKYKLFKYGYYQEKNLHHVATTKAKFAILCTGTESQGIAYMQLLSAGLPCYVFNNPTWKSDNGAITTPATSVPYFDERCGYVINNINLEHFEDFLSKIEEFSPRNYILENYTLEKGAQGYYNLLRISHEE